MKKEMNIIPEKPQVFDIEYIQSIPLAQVGTLETYISCDLLKARQGLTDQMWIPGTAEEASARYRLMKANLKF